MVQYDTEDEDEEDDSLAECVIREQVLDDYLQQDVRSWCNVFFRAIGGPTDTRCSMTQRKKMRRMTALQIVSSESQS